jgi:hypothetical protein
MGDTTWRTATTVAGGCVATIAAVILTMVSPVAGLGVIAVLGLLLWAWRRPVVAASVLAFLTAAFPKAGVKVGDFPFPVFLFGLMAAVFILWLSTPRRTHPPTTVLFVGAYLTLVAAKALQFSGDGPASVFAFVAWAALPIVVLAMTTSMDSVDPRFARALQWGFLFSVLYAGVQFVGGLEATAIPALTQALGDDITEKHNVIYVQGGENFSKIPSTYHNGNIYGLAAAVFLTHAMIRLLARRGTKLDVAVAVGSVLAIGLSGSRTAILAAGAAIVILVLRRGSMRWRVGIVAIALLAAGAVLVLEPDLARRYTVDAVISSGGSGRSAIWATYLSAMTPTDLLLGADTRAGVPDGWVGVLLQIGILGVLLLIAAVVTMMKRRPEWRLILVVLFIGAVIDSSYVTFPTWFIPAALVAVTLGGRVETPTALGFPERSRRPATSLSL